MAAIKSIDEAIHHVKEGMEAGEKHEHDTNSSQRLFQQQDEEPAFMAGFLIYGRRNFRSAAFE